MLRRNVPFRGVSFEAGRESMVGKICELECGPMPNAMAAQPNIGGALCESSVIPFLVPRLRFMLNA